jgi:hypothetical protein
MHDKFWITDDVRGIGKYQSLNQALVESCFLATIDLVDMELSAFLGGPASRLHRGIISPSVYNTTRNTNGKGRRDVWTPDSYFVYRPWNRLCDSAVSGGERVRHSVLLQKNHPASAR